MKPFKRFLDLYVPDKRFGYLFLTNSVLWIFLIFAPSAMHAQWKDSFTDGNFTSQPTWSGDTSCFSVNSSGQLQLKAPAVAGKAFLSTPSDVIVNANWSFSVRMDFNPSSSNYCKVYLIADNSNMNMVKNGYYLRFGYTTDNICLYKVKGTRDSLILKGTDKMLDTSQVNLNVKITRNALGSWTVYADTTGGKNLKLIGEGSDKSYFPGKAFGIQCIYTQTRSTKFFFDDFSITGKPFKDSIAPYVKSFEMKNDSMLRLVFSESMDSCVIHPENYKLADNPTVTIIPVDSSVFKTFDLQFTQPFKVNSQSSLSLSNIHDTCGNAIRDTSLLFTRIGPLDVENVVFTPNNDGNADFFKIMSKLQNSECRLTINVYDASGRLVRHLFNDRISGGDFSLIWDGINDTGRLSSTGIYIVHILAVYNDGTINEYKKVCVLSNRN